MGTVVNAYAHTLGGGQGTALSPPADTTVTNTSDYDAFPKVMEDGDDHAIIFTRGNDHQDDHEIFEIVSSDGAQTYGTATQIVTDADFYRNMGGGVLSDGDAAFVFGRYNSAENYQDARPVLRADGTWSVGSAISITEDTGLAYGRLVEFPNGDILLGFVGIDGSGNRTIFVMDSDDKGATWSNRVDIDTEATGVSPTEPAIIALDTNARASSTLLCVTRNQEGPPKQYKSTDGGATWTDMGFLPFGVGGSITSNTADASPDLYLLSDDRVVLAWADRRSGKLRYVIGSKTDVLASNEGWGFVRTAFDSGTGGYWLGYPSLFRVSGDDDLLGVVFADEASSTDADLKQRAVDVAAIPLLVEDAFTDTNGTLLSAHTPDTDSVGGGWSLPSENIDIQSNQANRDEASAFLGPIAVIDAGESDVHASAMLTIGYDPGNSSQQIEANQVGFMLRYVDGDNLWALYIKPTDSINILERNAGANTVRASTTFNYENGTYRMDARAVGQTIEVMAEGYSAEYGSASVHETETTHGMYVRARTGTDDHSVDDFKIGDAS